MTEAVILVPGIMGSVLKDGNEVIWPGSPLELVFPYSHMKELLSPSLVATDVIRNVSISSQYADLIESLEACGFNENIPIPTLRVFPYDWRKDNALAAKGLADCIDQMAAQLEGDSEINLVAHSMGGLVSRCYLESGDYNARPGFLHVKRLITVGTPHRGSPIALSAALGQEKRLFLNAEQVQAVANNLNFPSLYQLLPPRGEPFAWDRTLAARFNPVDVFDSAVAAQLELVSENLDSATQFHAKLNLNRRPQHVRYFFFAGTRQTTTSSVQVTLSPNGTARMAKIEREDSGDGTVPIWSGSQSGIQMEPVGGEHGELYKNGNLKRILGALLGQPGVMLAAGTVPEVTVRHKVVNPLDAVQATIDFPQGTTEIRGSINLRRVVSTDGVEHSDAPVSSTYPVTYTGPQIDHLAILIDAPQYAGVYELSYVSSESGAGIAKTELFVQEAS